MVSQERKQTGILARSLGWVAQVVGSAAQACGHAMSRLGAQVRAASMHPLRPFPLVHVAGGVATGSVGPALSAQETLMMREEYRPLGIAGLPQATLQHAHRFLTQLPTWLPMPETRRQGQGQVALEWTGKDARRFSVVIGPDGMVIYSARLGPKGRLDGAEPISNQLSPIIKHVIRQLRP